MPLLEQHVDVRPGLRYRMFQIDEVVVHDDRPDHGDHDDGENDDRDDTHVTPLGLWRRHHRLSRASYDSPLRDGRHGETKGERREER